MNYNINPIAAGVSEVMSFSEQIYTDSGIYYADMT